MSGPDEDRREHQPKRPSRQRRLVSPADESTPRAIPDREDLEEQLVTASLRDGNPTGWFDPLYRAGAAGQVSMPWSRSDAHPLLTQWATARNLTGAGRRAIVIGCGLGADAEYIAGLGFDTIGFDISPTAIELARGRFPNSSVRYVAADLLDPPGAWLRAFDLVVEVITVQALPEPARRQAIVNVGRLVGPAGTLVVVAAARNDGEEASDPPPWPLTRGEVEAFTTDGLATVRIEDVDVPGHGGERRWRAEFVRKA